MKQTTIYLPEETEANLQQLALTKGKSVSEFIEEIVNNYVNQTTPKLPKSLGMGASGRNDLSSKVDELLSKK